MSVPLCHSSGGPLKETNEKSKLATPNEPFLSSPERKQKKHFSLYRHCCNFYVLPYAHWLFFFLFIFFKNICCLLVSLCRVQYSPHITVSHLRRSAICHRIILTHSHFCRTFTSNCSHSSNDLPSWIWSVPLSIEPMHKAFALCLCYAACTNQAKHCDHGKSGKTRVSP